ncbi:MAG TPA: DUF885 domain-containing protein [Gemmatimonadales bacterium]|nr:DUF885 domain-containing protein [Gemmatimonadales bacterium]
MTAEVNDLCRSYLDLKYHFDPAAASAAGLVTQDSRLGRFDAETSREHLSALRSVAAAIEELDSDDLQSEIDRTALLGEIRSTVYRLEHEQPNVRNPAVWLTHLFQSFYTLLTRSEPQQAGRAAAVLSRLKSVPDFLDTARATLDDPPSVFVDTALAMLGGGGELIAQAVGRFTRMAPDLAGELNKAGEAALKSLVNFGAALRDEIEPNTDRQAFAIGEEQFSRRLQHEHALMAGPAEVWRYGLRLQEEVTGALTDLARRMSHRSWRDLVDELRDDTPPAEALLASYRSEVERACHFIAEHDLAGAVPGGVDVVPTPAYLTALVPFAAYEPPPIYLQQHTGRFYVTEPDPVLPPEAQAQRRRSHCRHAIPVMVAHEVYPGHHLHLATMQQLDSEVRRHVWSPIMVEGWALYAEQLMAEAGYYRSDEARLFQLVNLLWRAVRVVLDVGLHTRGMSPAEAVEYMVHHLPIERLQAEAEVRRYCAWPSYQLCYALGRRELLALREAYRNKHGANVSLRRFHDELMRFGGMPVSLARWGMGLAE